MPDWAGVISTRGAAAAGAATTQRNARATSAAAHRLSSVGCHTGPPFWPLLNVRRVMPSPFVFDDVEVGLAARRVAPVSLVNAISSPSGDQTGPMLSPGPLVSRIDVAAVGVDEVEVAAGRSRSGGA